MSKRTVKKIPFKQLVERSFPEEEKKRLYAAILCGEVRILGERIRDPKRLVSVDSIAEWSVRPFVSRGGEKLAGALDALHLNPQNQVCLDAGASTGGFTDCLLSRGASFVHAVDVGFNQLAWKLRTHPQVLSREQTNIMDLSPSDLQPSPKWAVADLSFRSLRGAASQLLHLTHGGLVLALVKPQFENPLEEGFDGIVRTSQAREAVLQALRRDLPQEGAHVINAVASEVTGRKGNAEIFLLISAEPADQQNLVDQRIELALEEAQNHLSPPE
ncbi:MAG: TlyA family RNA methyltransferase [Spirochaetales bacterium]|nr:TlyA family RNA methyltransferase [Spirochaetales bacterium]